MIGIIGEKLGMTQVYNKDGLVVPVTVVRVLPNTVVDIKTNDKNGYSAVQVVYEEQKKSRLNKAELGFYNKIKVPPHKHSKEFRTDRSSEYTVGMKLTVNSLSAGDLLNIRGVSKGKGFQGVMKLYHFSGGCDSHGTSVAHRVPGSIGQGTDPGRVIPGTKLPRHMGDEAITVKNLEVVGVESEQNLVLIKGALPGARSSRVYIYPHSAKFESKLLDESNNKKDSDKAEGKNKEKAA